MNRRTIAILAVPLLALAGSGCVDAPAAPDLGLPTIAEKDTGATDTGATDTGPDGNDPDSDPSIDAKDTGAAPPDSGDSRAPLSPGAEQSCFENGVELGCLPGMTCLLDGVAATAGRCKKLCETNSDCEASERCVGGLLNETGIKICVTPAYPGSICDPPFAGSRVCINASDQDPYFPFCVDSVCQYVCGDGGGDFGLICPPTLVCGNSLHRAPGLEPEVNLCEPSTLIPAEFGDGCFATSECALGSICLHLGSPVRGFCTNSCDEIGDTCPGAPAGTYAFCAYSLTGMPDSYVCGFACKYSGVYKKCPSPEMACILPDDIPASAGFKICKIEQVCNTGDTQPCDPIGQCTGGLRHCDGIDYGACAWTTGPTDEVCDGHDNNCDGTVDNNVAATLCVNQEGACAGATRTCIGGAWQDCGTNEFTANGVKTGVAYQATESACDALDNDCNGETDEPASCCEPQCEAAQCGGPDGCGGACKTGECPAGQACGAGICKCAPDCAGKACGAADGCGGICKSGSCPFGESCAYDGVCKCTNSCGSACCSPSQNCYGGACCTPNCAGQVCGGPDGCGGSCQTGPCAGPAACSFGTCKCDHKTCDGGCCSSGFKYCTSKYKFSSILYCASTCAADGFGCQTSSDCCGSLSCYGGECK